MASFVAVKPPVSLLLLLGGLAAGLAACSQPAMDEAGGRADRALTKLIATNTTNGAPLFIGRAPKPVENRYFRGALDEVRVDRLAVTADEIRHLARS